MAMNARDRAVNRITGQCLQDERRRVGMKQAALAARLGISEAYLSCLENGKTRLRVDTLIQVCAILKTDPAKLLMQIAELTLNVPRETSP